MYNQVKIIRVLHNSDKRKNVEIIEKISNFERHTYVRTTWRSDYYCLFQNAMTYALDLVNLFVQLNTTIILNQIHSYDVAAMKTQECRKNLISSQWSCSHYLLHVQKPIVNCPKITSFNTMHAILQYLSRTVGVPFKYYTYLNWQRTNKINTQIGVLIHMSKKISVSIAVSLEHNS